MSAPATGSAPCLWLTGRRGAGKRTIAALAENARHDDGLPAAVLDAEALTEHLARGPQDDGLASLAWLANLLTGNGIPVIVTVDTPRRADREPLRAAITRFVEVLVDAPVELCAERAGLEDRGYEAPIAPDLRVPTGDRDARASAALLLSYLETLTEPTS